MRAEIPLKMDGIEVRDWSQMPPELVFLYDGHIHPEHLTLRGYFDDLSGVLIREGEAVLETAGGRVTARAGDWVLAPQGERSQQYSQQSCVLSIHFLLSWPGRLPVYDWDTVLVVPSGQMPEMEAAGKRLEACVSGLGLGDSRRVRYAKTSLPAYFQLSQYLVEWLECYSRALGENGVHPTRLGTADPRVLKVAQTLERHSFRNPISQVELAAGVNLSVNQLVRLFRASFRTTPKAYMEYRRAREAYLRVQSSKDSFKEIAYDLGFYSPAHFSTWFGKRFSHTPRKVRESGHSLFPSQL